MTTKKNVDLGTGILSGYTALDLTEGGSLICGRLLADLGVRVIKIEPPGGSPSRNIGPYYEDTPHPEKSLFWMGLNLNKLGITLNLKSADGKKIFKKLVQKADFVLESFTPGYMKDLGLDYSTLSGLNRRIIMVSMTPYGQTGPKAQYKSSDLAVWASSGVLYVTGPSDKAPVAIGYPPQASMQAAVDGAVGALTAHWYREATGEGQHCDVSMQESNIMLLQGLIEAWDLVGQNYKRAGAGWVTGTGVNRTTVFPCKDGYVATIVFGGSKGPAKSTGSIAKWMAEEGLAPDYIKQINWADFDATKLTQEKFNPIETPFKKFFLTKTKQELWERALKEGIFMAPVNTVEDIRNSPQAEARGMWVDMPHSELNKSLPYWGPFVKISEMPVFYRRRAPLIGEDNESIYAELGLSKSQLCSLKQADVI